eukprot:CAMPEP_0194206158 /NCGR_PEP_ID=MMETSP0156-20130528/5259_1 /TAXON_ID=33649 /ORGANISM="Thalassionema nitzschioides, Strain L26-B" /LENGTH=248 /DNA_ID=CAMNT_0038932601 /DNA_START=326 /DNA_END=1072 /DNA_ORIENTATION=-
MDEESNPQQGSSFQPGPVSSGHSLKIPATQKDARKLFVGGIGNVTEEEFRVFFEQFGALVDSVVMFDRDTGRSRGFGFITYEDHMVCRKLLMMGNENVEGKDPMKLVGRIEMRGKMCEVKAATPREREYKVRKETVTKHKRGNQNKVHREDNQFESQFEMYGYNYPHPPMFYCPPVQYNFPYGHHHHMDYPSLMNPAVPIAINPQLENHIPFVPPVGIPIMDPSMHPHGDASDQLLTIESQKSAKTYS